MCLIVEIVCCVDEVVLGGLGMEFGFFFCFNGGSEVCCLINFVLKKIKNIVKVIRCGKERER